MTTTQIKNNGKCDACNDFDNPEHAPLVYISWIHHDPTSAEGWSYEQGERVKGYYCLECLNSIRKLQHKHAEFKTYTITMSHTVDVEASNEHEASSIAFAIRGKLDMRSLKVTIDEA